MVSLYFDRHILTKLELFVFNKFTFYSGDNGIDFLYRRNTFFSNKPYFYQYNFLDESKVFTFDIKLDNNNYIVSVKCGNIKLKDGTIIKPTNKVVEGSLSVFISDFSSFKMQGLEDDILSFSVITLPRLLFSNYKLNDNRTLHDNWVDVRNIIVREIKQAEEQRELERVDELRRRKEEEELKINELMGEEVF